MELGRAFTFATQDPDWLKKIGVAALLMIIPFIGWLAVLGWGLEITRRVIAGEDEMLPDWSNFMDHLVRGLKGFVVTFVLGLPGGLINFCQSSISALTSNPSLTENLGSGAATALTSVSGVLALCCGCLGILLGLAATFIAPAALGNMMAKNGDLQAAFRFNEVIGLLRAGIGPYLMTFLGTIIVGLIVPFGLIACLVGVLATAAWGTTVTSHLYGQAYKAAQGTASVL